MQLIQRAQAADADFVEVRLDALKADSDLRSLTSVAKVPLIAADKSNRTPADHEQLVLNSAKRGFSYIDVDLSSPKAKDLANRVKAEGGKCLVSFHDFNSSRSPAKLRLVLKKEMSMDADVCKIVVTPRRFEDNLPLLQLVAENTQKSKLVCFGMGEYGWPSRFLSPVLGGFFTFASLEKGRETAPGQTAIGDLKQAYRLFGLS